MILNDLTKIDVLGLHSQNANHKRDNTIFTSNIYNHWAGFNQKCHVLLDLSTQLWINITKKKNLLFMSIT